MTEKDLPALRELFLKVRQKTFFWLDNSSYNLSSFDKETDGEYIMVAYLNQVVVGFVSLYSPDNFIHNLYVHTDYQNQGVGTALLKAAIIQMAPLPVRLKCLKENKNAVAFYEKNGFQAKSQGISYEGIYILFEYES